MTQHSAADIGRLIADLRATMTPPNTTPETEPQTVRTTAADGLIEIIAAPGGRIEAVNLDPRVMRMPSQTLGEELRDAVNAALDTLRSAVPTADATDPSALKARLEEIQTTSVQQMQSFVQAITDAQQQMTSRRAPRP
jgi:hypothetical protein